MVEADEPGDRFWRARQYAVALTKLEAMHSVGLVDEALNNGLAAIVAECWPDELLKGGQGHVKSARALIEVIRERGDVDENDRFKVDSGREMAGSPFGDVEDLEVKVDLSALEELIARAEVVRHSRGPGSVDGITDTDVDLIRALDAHPALLWSVLEREDAAIERALEEDEEEIARAFLYWEGLPEWERERRRDPGLARHNEPLRPKDQLEYVAPQTCPVCLNETLVVEGTDMFGLLVGHGTCVACSYRRSEEIAHQEAIGLKIELQGSD